MITTDNTQSSQDEGGGGEPGLPDQEMLKKAKFGHLVQFQKG